MTIKKLEKQIIDDVKNNPTNWTETKYTLVNNRHTEIWIANGLLFYGVHRPYEKHFSFINKIKFFFIFRKNRDKSVSKWDGKLI